MANHLIIYQSTNGQTKKISHFILDIIRAQTDNCSIKNITNIDKNIQLTDYRSILFALPVRYGKHNKQAIKFIKAHIPELKTVTTGLISVNLTARKSNKNSASTNPYLIKLLDKLNWKPNFTAVIAGALKYPEYVWYDKLMIRLIMKMTKGPTDPSVCTEFTDWDQVKSYMQEYLNLIPILPLRDHASVQHNTTAS